MKLFTFHHSPFTILYPFSVFRSSWINVNSKRKVNGKRIMVNAAGGRL